MFKLSNEDVYYFREGHLYDAKRIFGSFFT